MNKALAHTYTGLMAAQEPNRLFVSASDYDTKVAELAAVQDGYAIRNDEVTGLLGIERELRARVAELEFLTSQSAKGADHG